MKVLDFPLWLRAAHFFNFLLLSLLIRSGLEILSAHPRFYWNDHCTPGSEWLKFTKKQPRASVDFSSGVSRKWHLQPPRLEVFITAKMRHV